jgi:2,3-bisphosphoglycerate-dependent phosphoglycerate mutase
MRRAGLRPTAVHTSLLRRAVDTADIAMAEAGGEPVHPRRDRRLNERNYGHLQGRSRAAVRAELGDEAFHRVRRSYDTAAPGGESLADVAARVAPYWHANVLPDLRRGHTTLIVAHGNSLRALCLHLNAITPAQAAEVDIPTGVPLRYDLDDALTPVVQSQ